MDQWEWIDKDLNTSLQVQDWTSEAWTTADGIIEMLAKNGSMRGSDTSKKLDFRPNPTPTQSTYKHYLDYVSSQCETLNSFRSQSQMQCDPSFLFGE
jgi:hypothetical protein